MLCTINLLWLFVISLDHHTQLVSWQKNARLRPVCGPKGASKVGVNTYCEYNIKDKEKKKKEGVHIGGQWYRATLCSGFQASWAVLSGWAGKKTPMRQDMVEVWKLKALELWMSRPWVWPWVTNAEIAAVSMYCKVAGRKGQRHRSVMQREREGEKKKKEGVHIGG